MGVVTHKEKNEFFAAYFAVSIAQRFSFFFTGI
jgi:hypothetical protein